MAVEERRDVIIRTIAAWLQSGIADFADLAQRFERQWPNLAGILTTRQLQALIEEAKHVDT